MAWCLCVQPRIHLCVIICMYVCTCRDISVKPIISEKRMVTASYSWFHKSYNVNNQVEQLKELKTGKRNIIVIAKKKNHKIWSILIQNRLGCKLLHSGTCPRTLRPSRRSSTAFGGSMENRSSSLHSDILNVSKLTSLCVICQSCVVCTTKLSLLVTALKQKTKLPIFFKYITFH